MAEQVSYDFTGRVALVTGGSSGIGASIARMLLRSGATVAIADINRDAVQAFVETAQSQGGQAIGLYMDVRSPESCDDAISQIVEHSGGLHYAANAAGILSAGASLDEYSPDIWRKLMSVNLDGVFFSMASEYRAMRASGGGSIVNISSVMGTVASALQPAYAAAKHGVVGLTKSAALDGAQYGIRVNAIGPGFVETAFQDHMSVALKYEYAQRHALKRFAQPDEISGLVCWLLSDQASFVTGSYHMADGGYTAM